MPSKNTGKTNLEPACEIPTMATLNLTKPHCRPGNKRWSSVTAAFVTIIHNGRDLGKRFHPCGEQMVFIMFQIENTRPLLSHVLGDKITDGTWLCVQHVACMWIWVRLEKVGKSIERSNVLSGTLTHATPRLPV